MKPPFLRTAYNYDMNKAGDESAIACADKSLAQQHMADECDINKLVERFVVTGEIPQLTLPPLQADFNNVPDFQTAMNMIVEANHSFMQMPANVRSRFNNDAGQFVAFCSDEQNNDDLRKMGLWNPEATARFDAANKKAKEAAAADAAALKAFRENKVDPKKGTT